MKITFVQVIAFKSDPPGSRGIENRRDEDGWSQVPSVGELVDLSGQIEIQGRVKTVIWQGPDKATVHVELGS